MSDKTLFRHCLLAGHGRAFALLKGHEEAYRSLVLWGCTNDISFDMQCEGSRGEYMYRITQEYADPAPFRDAVIERFLSPAPDADWHLMSHLTDFLDEYAKRGDAASLRAFRQKYDALYTRLMHSRWSGKMKQTAESLEYLLILLTDQDSEEDTERILRDIGAYFLRCRQTEEKELHWRFDWFFSHFTQNHSIHEFLQLQEKAKKSKELRRFLRILMCDALPSRAPEPPARPTAGVYLQAMETANHPRTPVLRFGRAEKSEKIKLAQMALAEPDTVRKAQMLNAFTFPSAPFPLDAAPIVEYARSAPEPLRETAMEVLDYIDAPSAAIASLARELLAERFTPDALSLLIRHFQPEDRPLLLSLLDPLEIDREERSGWHHVTLSILDSAGHPDFPAEALWWVYERSLCSCCREDALEKLAKRGLITNEIRQEMRLDANGDIRGKC